MGDSGGIYHTDRVRIVVVVVAVKYFCAGLLSSASTGH